MFLLSLVVGLGIGWLRRGSVFHLGHSPVRFLWLVALAFGLRLLVGRGAAGGEVLGVPASWGLAASYVCLLVAVLLNRRLPGMALLAAGTVLNLAVIFANGGRMPVSGEALAALGAGGAIARLAEGADPVHSLITPDTRLPFLADVLYLPPLVPLKEMFSAGDVLIGLAIAHLVQAGMRSRPGKAGTP